jgi:hypothetical protein
MNQTNERKSNQMNTASASGIGNLVATRRSMFKALGAATLGLIAAILTANPLVTKFQGEAIRLRGPETAQPTVHRGPRNEMRRVVR